MNDSKFAVMQSIQQQVNSEHQYQTDASGYNVGEHWAIMGPGDKGDCEDYVLTKMQALIDAGFSVKNLQVGTGITETGQNHAFLIIQTVNRGTMVLDNRYPNIMQLEKLPYRIQDYQRAGQTWANFATRLDNVAIEYMNCNAAAFADGDGVIVKFEGQDWSKPKVIGFASLPKACISGAIFYFINFASPWDKVYAYGYSVENFTFTKTAELSADPSYGVACGSPDNGTTVNFLGGDSDNFSTDPADWDKTTKKNYQYSISGDTWAIKADMLHDRSWFGCFSNLASTIYALGGWSRPSTYRASTEKYDPSGDSWSLSTDGLNLWIFGEVVLSGAGYTWGGNSGLLWDSTIASNRKFDPEAAVWSSKADLPKSMAQICAFEDFATQKGYIAGGATIGQWDSGKLIDAYGVYLTERLYEYDPVANSWTRKTDYPTYGCKAYYHVAAPPLPAGWYIDSDDCETPAGYGPYDIPAAGGIDQGIVVQKAIDEPAAVYHVMPTAKYQPSTDSWAVGELVPEKIWPVYSANNGCGCSI